jgi:hypothetical protein
MKTVAPPRPGERDFGNTLHQLRSISMVGIILSLIVTAIFLAVAYAHHRLAQFYDMLPISILLALILPAVIFPTCLVSIRVTRTQIQHLFLRRWLISEGPLADLQQVDLSNSSGMIFRFRDGSSIRFLGAHLRILQELCVYIRELRPEFSNFAFNQRSRIILAAINKLNPHGHEPTYEPPRW